MKKPSSPAAGSVSIESLEQQGREQLRQARFKEAVETFKKLVKQDKQPLWKERLNQAYVGYARHLAVKGMAKEAQITLENTANAGGLVQDPALYFSCLVLQTQYQKAAAFYRRISTSSAGASLAEAACVLDLISAVASDASVSGTAAPVSAPARALAAWCAGCPADELDRWLQTISLRSPAGSLRVILKALLLADAEKRAGFLRSIPSSSVFAGLARAAAAASCATGQWAAALEALTAAERRCVAEIRGSQPAATQLLLDFETAERRGPGALLSWLLANSGRFQKAALRAACLDLLPHAPDLLPRVEAKFCFLGGPLSLAEKYRIMALDAENRDPFGSAIPYWTKAAEAFATEGGTGDGAVAKLNAALIYRHMAPHTRGSARQNSANIHYLERSLELDPDDPDSVLALLKLLEHEGREQAWASRVAWALPRFPDHVAMLEAAIEAAIRRRAWQQASAYVQKLLAIDPINQQARQRMIEMCIAQARAQMRANRPDLAWQDLQQAAATDRSDQPDRALAISRALVEWRSGSCLGPGLKAGTGADLAPCAVHEAAGLCAIVAGNRSAVAGWFQILLEAWLMGVDDAACEPLIRHLRTAMHAPPFRKDDVMLVIERLGSRDLHDHETLLPKALDVIEPWLIANPVDEWPVDEFQQIAETLQQAGAFRALACYARQGRQQHPREPAYRFYEILAEIRRDGRQPGAGDIGILQDLSQQAADQEDFSLLNRIVKLMRELLPGQSSPQSWLNRFDFDDDDDEDDDDDLDDDAIGSDAPLAAILDAIGASRKKLLAMAKTSGIEATLDHIIKLLARAAGRRPLPLPKSVLKEVLRNMLTVELLEG
jgi:tetratricopeptide (TPR) repeat protein